jgi:hypothetical protein
LSNRTLRSDALNHVKLEIIAAQNTTVPDFARIDDTSKSIHVDGSLVSHSYFDSRSRSSLREGTLLYAKRLIVYRQVDPATRDSKKFEVTWQVALGKFLTLEQFCEIDDWSSLP